MRYKPYAILLGTASVIGTAMAGLLGASTPNAEQSQTPKASSFVCDATNNGITLRTPGTEWEVPASAGALPVALDATRITLTGYEAKPISLRAAFQAEQSPNALNGTYTAQIRDNTLKSCTFTNQHGDVTSFKLGAYTP